MSEILEALAGAVRAAPDSIPLRVHYGRLLLDAGRVADALEQSSEALRRSPSDEDALELMREATASTTPIGALGSSRPEPASDIDWRQLESEVAVDMPPPFVEGRAASEPDPGAVDTVGEITRELVTLADVGGLEAVKERIRVSFLEPMRNPDIARAFGSTLRGGLLLYGPPGTGKTFLARAVAGELGASFLSITIADVLDGVIGQSEQNVRRVFARARAMAPCVVFIDELDALGGKRSQYQNVGWMRTVVNQMLQEMDGVSSDNDGIFLLGATNQPWDVDPALLRPGRFDRTVLVLPPDEGAREAILRHRFAGRPIAGIDLTAIVARTDGYSGADLAHLIDTAAEHAMTESIAVGEVRPIGMTDIERALREVKPSVMPWMQSARNVVTFANGDGRYDDLGAYLRSKRLL